mgnify:CR=1 FL=1
MESRTITINAPESNEVSPVAKLVQIACQFESVIYLENGTRKVNAKSIMGMMALGIVPGQTVKISADGEDETQAIDSIEKYLGNK